jgi:hypothetical protein
MTESVNQNPHYFQRTTPCPSCCLVYSMALHCVTFELPVFPTKIPPIRTRSATSESTAMGRVFIGLLFFSLAAWNGARGGEPPASGSDPGASLEKPSPAGQMHSSKGRKRMPRAEGDARSGPRSLPLSSAAAYALEHPTTLPMSSPSQPAPPASQTWTGFYVGAGAGAARP